MFLINHTECIRKNLNEQYSLEHNIFLTLRSLACRVANEEQNVCASAAGSNGSCPCFLSSGALKQRREGVARRTRGRRLQSAGCWLVGCHHAEMDENQRETRGRGGGARVTATSFFFSPLSASYSRFKHDLHHRLMSQISPLHSSSSSTLSSIFSSHRWSPPFPTSSFRGWWSLHFLPDLAVWHAARIHTQRKKYHWAKFLRMRTSERYCMREQLSLKM